MTESEDGGRVVSTSEPVGRHCTHPWDREEADEPPPDRIEIHYTELPGKGYRLLSIRDRLPVAEFAFVSAGWDAVELRGDPPDAERVGDVRAQARLANDTDDSTWL